MRSCWSTASANGASSSQGLSSGFLLSFWHSTSPPGRVALGEIHQLHTERPDIAARRSDDDELRYESLELRVPGSDTDKSGRRALRQPRRLIWVKARSGQLGILLRSERATEAFRCALST